MYRTNSMTYQTKTPPLQGRAAFLKNTNNMLKASKNNLHLSNRFCTFEVTVELDSPISNFSNQYSNTFGHAGVSSASYRKSDSTVSDSNVLLAISLRMTVDKEKVSPLLQGGRGYYDHSSKYATTSRGVSLSLFPTLKQLKPCTEQTA